MNRNMPKLPPTTPTSTTTPTPTLPPCPVPNAVRNSQPPVIFSDGRTAEYTCAFGFRMSGNSRVTCFGNPPQWHGSVPSCDKIKYDPHHPIWAYGLIAGLLGLIALTFILCLIGYCCGWCSNSVMPLGGSNSTCSCCRRSRRRGRRRSSVGDEGITMTEVEHNGAYFIPVGGNYTNKERHVQKTVRHIVVSDPKKGHQDVTMNGLYASDTYLVPVRQTPPKERQLWLPHSRPVRENRDLTK